MTSPDENITQRGKCLKQELALHSEDEVGTGSGSDRVTITSMSIIVIGLDPVATAPDTDSITSAGKLRTSKRVHLCVPAD